MLSNVRCPQCQHKFWIQEGEMGSRQTCPACQAQFFAGASVAEARAKVGAPSAAAPDGYNKTMIGESAPVIKYNCPRCKSPLEGEAGSKKNCPNCTQRHQVPDAPKPEPAAAAPGLNKTMLVGNDSAAAPPRPPIKYNCPTCNKPLEAPAEQGGTKINCPACSQRLQIPAAPPVVSGLNKTRLASDASAAPASALQTASAAAGGASPAAAAPPASPWATMLTPTNVLLGILVVLILLLVVPAVIRGGKVDNSDALAKAQQESEKLKKEIDEMKMFMARQTKEEGDLRRQHEEAMRRSREEEEKRREADRARLQQIQDENQRAAAKRQMDQEQQQRERDRQERERKYERDMENMRRTLDDTKRALDAKQTTIIQQPPPVYYPPYHPRYYWPWGW
jgi:DNA-directed RNA polymerase subunit RPC12/RpoP